MIWSRIYIQNRFICWLFWLVYHRWMQGVRRVVAVRGWRYAIVETTDGRRQGMEPVFFWEGHNGGFWKYLKYRWRYRNCKPQEHQDTTDDWSYWSRHG